MTALRTALVWAGREMRSGLSGFRIFFACLVLGVASIAGVGSLADAFLTGMSEQGRVMLGGDVSVQLVHRTADAGERAFLARYGHVSETASMRAMAYAIKNGKEAERQLIELKAVDGAYPLYGAVTLSNGQSLDKALRCDASVCGAVVEQTLLDRLNLRVGGIVRVGTQTFRVAAVLTGEPDRISGGFSLGPHVMISAAALARTGLVTLGSLIDYDYGIAAAPGFSLPAFKKAAAGEFPDAGWQIRDASDAAPSLRRFVEQATMFLTLVGLAALAVGGVGAGQAISAFLDRKRSEIAVLKALGADGRLIFLTSFVQVMAIAALAVAVGLIAGAAVPYAVAALYAASIPVPANYAVYWQPLILAAAFGFLSAAAFAIPPLARAREIAPASLFRDIVAPAKARGRWPYLAAAAVAAAAIVALALAISPDPIFAATFLGGAVVVLLALRLVAGGLRWLVAHAPRPRAPVPRLALANLARPGAATAGVVTALGLGLSLLATVSLLDRTISAEVADRLPSTAPSFFFVDITPDEAAPFDRIVARFKSAADYERSPMIRGRIVCLNGVAAKDAHIDADARWAVNGDRGITYAGAAPKGTSVAAGKWWAANYSGPTLISFDAELARGMHLKIGDMLTLNVLGRELQGRIANLRNVDFTTGRQNFTLVLSPGVIDKAPHDFLASVRVAPADEEPLYRAVTDAFPNVSAIRVKDIVGAVDALLQELGDGVRAASLVTILAGLLVLAGAIAAGQRARLYDATVLKVLGATRARVATIAMLEYGLMGLVTGAIALGVGALAAWLVATEVFDMDFIFDARAALITIGIGILGTLGFGMAAAISALSAKPAELLRNP